jgi:hypothetical protein
MNTQYEKINGILKRMHLDRKYRNADYIESGLKRCSLGRKYPEKKRVRQYKFIE